MEYYVITNPYNASTLVKIIRGKVYIMNGALGNGATGKNIEYYQNLTGFTVVKVHLEIKEESR